MKKNKARSFVFLLAHPLEVRLTGMIGSKFLYKLGKADKPNKLGLSLAQLSPRIST